MTAPAPDFDAAREAYEAARLDLNRLIINPEKHLTVKQYRTHLLALANVVDAAHNKMLEAWK
ncbi:hypothetical protein NIBR502772_05885 [Pseudarthrobacter sp. NIBRBAC000502772]|uniref:hypothetical protein n=1 Tax=Pseudarthrobacter sp. NIBRBAC000502772 TaxID=2590775 RepID=UPI0011327B33|nr:hypothetical protein [Pseudarthrobacter sp. NIBRBAC000502772]QDG65804.1 hypothetical protein NIBR502772_05885 [Pseudarthrobacter sp. NIBRBAC000502772]